jgi:PEP-CTERM motif-containing protein
MKMVQEKIRSGSYLAVAGALLIGLLTPGMSQATLTGLCGPLTAEPQQLGFCQKSMTLSGTSLTITLTNTSPAANGGLIVADAFNLPGGISATLTSTTNLNFDTFLEGVVKTSPFGTRTDIISLGGGLNNAFEGAGGSSTGGIGVGQSATFVFNLSGSGASESDIFNSELVRFKGFHNGAGDKTGVTIEEPSTVPEPTMVLLVGSGMTGLMWLRRKLR